MATKTKKVVKTDQASKTTKPISKIVAKTTLIDRISDQIAKQHNLTKNQIDTVLSEYLEQTKQALVKQEEIRLTGYYTFKSVMSKPRVAMNLKTKAKMNIPAKLTPKVKFSKELKEVIANSKVKK
ncbi:MAG: HU family DNA-binding protein [Spiroplasmataceae bacterium]|jgi:DNA-binding protein HU-beta|nr:HU family DNA-binding protein [Spiroplasmataceae bacterium]